MHFELDVQDDSPYPTQTTTHDGIAFVDDMDMGALRDAIATAMVS
jgi:hypothetical protein